MQLTDLKLQKINLVELHIDRAYLSSSLVQNRSDELAIYCKAWQVKMASDLRKLLLSWTGTIKLFVANQVTLPFTVAGKVQFPKGICATCPLRERCTTSRQGRSVSIHPDEPLFWELQQRQLTPAGRAKLRERVAVEHIPHWSMARRPSSLLALARTYLTFAVQPLSIIFMSLPKCLLTLLRVCYSILITESVF